MPRNSGGWVYCGASSIPPRPKLSSAVAAAPPPSTPGTRRTAASAIAAAAISPPVITKSPTEKMSVASVSMRASKPS